MFNKILIANRGEIACRIIKTAHRLGIETVAIYSQADQQALHVSMASEAFCVGASEASNSYLNGDAIVQVAIESGAQAIHPGYGFLSENPAFARLCESANLVFIGPGVDALDIMGSKQLAKQLLEKTDVPLTPGYHGDDQSDDTLLKQATKLGFPVLLKAANGGGGKGMRAVQNAQEFQAALDSARRESMASFGSDTMLIEKLIQTPRHIEIQIMADHHGQVVHLFERDCSIQRRHQKIIEEAPAYHFDPELREQLAQAAITVAQSIQYRGAGTIEFLVDENHQFYFMEMNTRLQVEHPVTEMITGLDLVEWQLRIASGEPLPKEQPDIHAHGHAIECRIYAEDPSQQFMPSIGQVTFLQEPSGDGIRIDSGVVCSSNVSRYYDPMIAKLITWGETRSQAQQRMQQALSQYHVGGIKTNIPFLQAVIQHPKFIHYQISTHFLAKENIHISKPSTTLALTLSACMDYYRALPQQNTLLFDAFAWQMHLNSAWLTKYSIDHELFTLRITPVTQNQVTLEFEDQSTTWHLHFQNKQLTLVNEVQRIQATVDLHPEAMTFYTDEGVVTVQRYTMEHTSAQLDSSDAHLTAPMPGTVVAVLKNKGESVKAGDCIMILEAMKMEHSIQAPTDGLLTEIFYEVGAQVNTGEKLLSLEPSKA